MNEDILLKSLVVIVLIIMTFIQMSLYEKIKILNTESINNNIEIKTLREELKDRSYVFQMDSLILDVHN